MILLLVFLVSTDHEALMDSLQRELEHEIRVSTINDLNKTYVQIEAYNRAITLLETYENQVAWND